MTGHNLVSGGRMKKSFLALFVCVVLAAAFWPAPSAARDYDVQKDAASTADLAAVNGTGPAVQIAQVQPPPAGYGPPTPPPAGYGPPPPPPAAVAPPPAFAFATPPDVVPIPGTYAYFVPGIGVDVLFYGGSWYRPFGGHWFRAASYNGPWLFTPGPRVPGVLVHLPHGWRNVPRGYRPIPHAELHGNWEKWERERHWDHHR